MRSTLIVVTLLVTLAAVCLAEDVVTLTPQTFGAAVAKGGLFIKFYAPWCGHCKRLAPAWDELATAVKAADPSVTIAKVDCTVYRGLCSSFGVKGYPTLKFIQGGMVIDYKGGRELEALKAFALAKNDMSGGSALPAVNADEAPAEAKKEEKLPERDASVPSDIVMLTDSDVFEKLQSGTWFVSVTADWCGHCKKLLPAYEALATKYKNTAVKVAKINGPDNPLIAGQLGVRGFPSIFYVSNGRYIKYELGRTLDEMSKYIDSTGPALDVAAMTPVPSAPALLDRLVSQWHEVFAIVEGVVEQHVLPSIGVTFLLGAAFGFILRGGSSEDSRVQRRTTVPANSKDKPE